MSVFDSIKKAVKYAEPAFAALEAIQHATSLGGPLAGTALHVIDSLLKSFTQGVENDIPAAELVAEIERQRNLMAAKFAANDATADAALGRKFP